MASKTTDIRIGGRFWSTTVDGKIVDVEQVEGLDTKLSSELDKTVTKVTSIGTYDRAYIVGAGGEQSTMSIATGTVASALVKRNANNQITVPTTPLATNDATSKSYVDDEISKVSQHLVYVTDEDVDNLWIN